jgi:hypothetical protein
LLQSVDAREQDPISLERIARRIAATLCDKPQELEVDVLPVDVAAGIGAEFAVVVVQA